MRASTGIMIAALLITGAVDIWVLTHPHVPAQAERMDEPAPSADLAYARRWCAAVVAQAKATHDEMHVDSLQFNGHNFNCSPFFQN